MTTSEPGPQPAKSDVWVAPLRRIELAFAQRTWAFAEARRAAVEAHFAAARHGKPKLWNGRILLLHQHAIEREVFRGACLETDFASFLAWRDWDFPDASVRNCFGMAALRSSDGAFLLGVMGPHTANAGKCYFPSGSLEPSDIVGNTIDIEGSIRRELAEETGLDAGAMEAEPGWYAVFAGARIAMMKVLQARERAEVLRARILHHLSQAAEPELVDIRIVRGWSDVDPSMPSHTSAFFEHIWQLNEAGAGASRSPPQ